MLMTFRLKTVILVYVMAVCTVSAAIAQGIAKISPDKQVFNFGTIAEEKGPASHEFIITNTGDAPLVINRITASCGCTRPSWDKSPIAPGKSTSIKITYNPQGRPGPFYKTITIISNSDKKRFNLAIKGNVTPKPKEPKYEYLYSIGDLKLHKTNVLFSKIIRTETKGEKIHIKNTGKTSAVVHIGKHPHYLTINSRPDTILPGKTGEITLLFDAMAAKHKGRKYCEIPVEVSMAGRKSASGIINVAANIIDDFSKLTSEERKNAPVAKLSGSILDFGEIKGETKSVYGTVELTNSGKQNLHIYSVSSENDLIKISGGKKTIKPGKTVIYKIKVKSKDMPEKFNASINWVCDSPDNPVITLKVLAKKKVEK